LLFAEGLVTYAADGVGVVLIAAGRAALEDYERRRAQLDAEPTSLTRNPLRGELHDPAEPDRHLFDVTTGAQIRPGDTILDPHGDPVTYLGATMDSHDGGESWLPGSTVRVRYDRTFHGMPWLFAQDHLGVVYADDPAASPGESAQQT
jgi:hypothetical protein